LSELRDRPSASAPRIPLLRRAWYKAPIAHFLAASDNDVLAQLVNSPFNLLQSQRDAWLEEVAILRNALAAHSGMVYLELVIPRTGRRVDAVVLVRGIVLAIEFKIEAKEYLLIDCDQAFDYASDLKYFHEGTHHLAVVPVLVATAAKPTPLALAPHPTVPGLYKTACTNAAGLAAVIDRILSSVPEARVDPALWEASRYCPTPTIIEAARALYAGHNVADISRSEAGAFSSALKAQHYHSPGQPRRRYPG
jgi:hypothetical protein